jgi:4-amino-4-deoxychorismate lyase
MKETFFETILCEDYEVRHLQYHKERIARTIGKNFNLQEYIYPPNHDLLKCKLIYDQDDIVNIKFETYTPKEIKTIKIVYDNSIEYKYKSSDRTQINNLYDQRESADEILILKNGLISDTSIANIAIMKEKQWLTPKQPLLQGTTRARLLDENFIKEADLTIADLKNCQKFAVMNAMIEFKILDNVHFVF